MPALAALSAPMRSAVSIIPAADQLRQVIVTGAVAPGVRPAEVAGGPHEPFAGDYPRGAVQRLVTEGLVVQRPSADAGNSASLTSRDAWELYTLRGAFEALAARLAAENIDTTKRRTLMEAFERLTNAANFNDPKAITDAVRYIRLSYHYRATADWRIVRSGQTQVRMYIASTNARLPKRQQVVQEHEGLVFAVASGNGDEAERLAREHSVRAGNDSVTHLKRQER